MRRLLTLSCWLAALPALARVGGGESFNSGRSESGDGDGGLGLDIVFLLVRLVLHYPALGVPLVLAVVGYLVWRSYHDGSASTRRALDAAEASRRTAVSAQAVASWEASLKAKDPAFELLPFLDRVKGLFLQVQEAWFLRELPRVRAQLSAATYQRLTTQLALLEAQGERDALADVQVLDLQIIGLEQSAQFDALHIRVRAQARDTQVPATASDETARAVAGRAPVTGFTEVWTFLRRPGATTRAGVGVWAGTCPNCGAPYEGGASNQCPYCQAIVNSAVHDWVLSEITQASEYVRPAAVPGLAVVLRGDPSFSLEVLEDRAALCFWRWVDAQARGAPQALAKVATPEFRQGLERQLAGEKKPWRSCAVGSVTTLGFQVEPPVQRARLEVRWSAEPGEGGPTLPRRSVLTLRRESGAVTQPTHGLSTDRCPSCHAPLTDGAAVTCEYCGAALASGALDWVLERLESWEAYLSQSAGRSTAVRRPGMERLPDRQERERLLYVMALVAAADGNVDRAERQLLRTCAERWGVAWANVELALAARGSLLDSLLAKGSPEAEAFLAQLVDMALVDGRVDATERRLLQAAAGHLGQAQALPRLLQR